MEPLAPMASELWHIAACGLGAAFVATIATVLMLLWKSEIDHGLLGLIFLIVIVLFTVAFSFIVAAATPGFSIKVAATVFSGILTLGSKLLSDRFLDYLGSDDTNDAATD
jgi:cobalamin biosynthesis protein CobD/CbiB